MAYEKIMTDAELKKRVLALADEKTCYLYGGLCVEVTDAIIETKAKQYPSWYTKARIAGLKALVGKGYTGTDCVNMIKSILWGYGTDAGMKYASNTVPDTSANGFISICENLSTDMTNIQPMEVIWFSGHVGLYLYRKNGVDYCVECAPSINEVGVTKMSYQEKWCKHGKMPWINYGYLASTVLTKQKEINDWIKSTGQSIILLEEDDIWGSKTSDAWLAYQRYLLGQKQITPSDVAKMAEITL